MPLSPSLRLTVADASHLLNGGLVGVDMAQMRQWGPNRPRIWRLIRDGRLKYERRDRREHWQTYDEMMRQLRRRGVAKADCEDLAAAGAAEMRLDRGWRWHDPGAETFVYKSAPRTSHVIIRSPRFGLLDPSVGGGMTLGGQPFRGPVLAQLPYPRPPKYHSGKRFVSVTGQAAGPAWRSSAPSPVRMYRVKRFVRWVA